MLAIHAPLPPAKRHKPSPPQRWLTLPHELLALIASYLDPDDLLAVRATCRAWASVFTLAECFRHATRGERTEFVLSFTDCERAAAAARAIRLTALDVAECLSTWCGALLRPPPAPLAALGTVDFGRMRPGHKLRLLLSLFDAECEATRLVDVKALLCVTRADLARCLGDMGAVLARCAGDGHVAKMRLLRELGFGRECARVGDNDALVAACRHNRVEVVWVLRREFGLEAADARAQHYLPLWWAMVSGREQLLEYFVGAFGMGVADFHAVFTDRDRPGVVWNHTVPDREDSLKASLRFLAGLFPRMRWLIVYDTAGCVAALIWET